MGHGIEPCPILVCLDQSSPEPQGQKLWLIPDPLTIPLELARARVPDPLSHPISTVHNK